MKDNFEGLISRVVEELASNIDGDAWSVFGTWADNNQDEFRNVSEKDVVTYYVGEVNKLMGNKINMSLFILSKNTEEYIDLFVEHALDMFDEDDDFIVEDI